MEDTCMYVCLPVLYHQVMLRGLAILDGDKEAIFKHVGSCYIHRHCPHIWILFTSYQSNRLLWVPSSKFTAVPDQIDHLTWLCLHLHTEVHLQHGGGQVGLLAA
ncbi:hypothetical protein NP493_108g02007 [Ridgeia piscesae]|uniref:Uncharacterized protein n=1 Tax=Ridgeia piscesae TaxID=27915 RepID=A0AAD9P728_RIDPI|nr:hypothetical protein NP493_108g02007 [Ridgeia piscesae]